MVKNCESFEEFMSLSMNAKKRDEKFHKRFVIGQDGDFFVILENLSNGRKQIKNYADAKHKAIGILRLMRDAYEIGWEDAKK